MAKQKLTWRHVMVLITCMLCISSVGGISFSCAGLCYKPVANYLGCQVSDVSLYMTILYIGQVIFSPIGGALLEKFDVRLVCGIAGALNGVGLGLMSCYTAIWQWYISGLFMGFGIVTIFWLMTAGVLGRWFKSGLGVALGLSYAMTGVGGAVFNILGQTVLGPSALTVETWRELYLIYGIIICVTTIPFILLFVRDSPEEVGLKALGAPLDDAELSSEPELKGFEPKQAYSKWYFWVLIVAGALMNILAIYPQHFTTFYQTAVACTTEGVQIPELMAMSGTLEAFAMVGMALGKVITGAIESKSLQAALISGVILGVLGVLGMWLGGASKILPILWGGGFVYGCVYAWVSVLLPYITRSIFGDLHYDKIYSVILIPVNLVGAFAASGLALLNQAFGWSVFFMVDLAMIVITWALATLVFKVGRKEYADKFENVAA